MSWRCLLLLLTVLVCHGQEPSAPVDAGLAQVLSFETDQPGPRPTGWGGGPTETIFVDGTTVRSGKWAVRIERTAESKEEFTSVTKTVALDRLGSRIELRGFVRTENVSNSIGLWIRADGVSGTVEFDSSQRPETKGTADWKEYSAGIRVNPEARTLIFGFLLNGTGKAWADDLQLLVDGKPIWEAPKAERVQTVLDRDHEFDGGSKINVTTLSPAQIENLATLGRVWGFLKYHHPRVAAGELHWDYELFRILPGILAAPDRLAANAALCRWVDGLGETKPAAVKAELPADLHLRSDTGWLEDRETLGAELSQRLSWIYANREPRPKQFFVTFAPNVSNPGFGTEPAYAGVKFPDTGYQLLGLFRYWNIIRYWFPYRDLIGENWDAVLNEYVPRVALAVNADEYKVAMLTLIARINDTHANLPAAFALRPPRGTFQLPVAVRFVGGEAVVTGVVPVPNFPLSPVQPGDVIEEIAGEPVAKLVEQWRPFYAASNEPTRLREIARNLTNGPVGEVTLKIRRDGQAMEIVDRRVAREAVAKQIVRVHDLPGEAFRLLSKDVAYLKLSAVKGVDLKDCIARAAGTKGLIIDIRNYPSEFVVFKLGSLLVDKPTEFARFTRANAATPGVFAFGNPIKLEPQSPHYVGRVVILVDEFSQSQAEYTTMAFRAVPGAIVVGSTTAGADGNFSALVLPGGLSTGISGIGAFYSDRRPTQRIGIIADIEAVSTIEGIKAGYDEVLEEGLRQILGPETSLADIRKLVPRPTGVSGVVPEK